jgi:hypothetical protein
VRCCGRRHSLALREDRCKKSDTFRLDRSRDGVAVAFSVYRYNIKKRKEHRQEREKTHRGSTSDIPFAVSSSDNCT